LVKIQDNSRASKCEREFAQLISTKLLLPDARYGAAAERCKHKRRVKAKNLEKGAERVILKLRYSGNHSCA